MIRKRYRQASPVNFVNGLEGKLMIGQGTGDDNVHLVNTMLVLNEAIKHGKNIEVVLLPGRGHPASDSTGRIYLMKRVAAFFEKNLQGNTISARAACAVTIRTGANAVKNFSGKVTYSPDYNGPRDAPDPRFTWEWEALDCALS